MILSHILLLPILKVFSQVDKPTDFPRLTTISYALFFLSLSAIPFENRYIFCIANHLSRTIAIDYSCFSRCVQGALQLRSNTFLFLCFSGALPHSQPSSQRLLSCIFTGRTGLACLSACLFTSVLNVFKPSSTFIAFLWGRNILIFTPRAGIHLQEPYLLCTFIGIEECWLWDMLSLI